MEVTFALDANGILAVTAQDTVTGAKAGAEIKAKDGRLSPDEIDRMVADAEKHRAQDNELADKVRNLPAGDSALPDHASVIAIHSHVVYLSLFEDGSVVLVGHHRDGKDCDLRVLQSGFDQIRA